MTRGSDPPAFIGRYRVVERISSGGMGVLYLARDPAIDRTVAIKVARVNNVELRERFLREARAAGRLNHPNIVTIFDVGDHAGEPFIAMEYVPGRTLAQIVERNVPLPLPRRLRMLRELCDGLACAHAQGIVHRDVKPANLIAHDDTGALTILDFGIARLSASGATMTGAGMVGTPHYMAPEQIEGAHIDQRCDVFSSGLVFYELLSYRRAFDGESPTAVLYEILHNDPAPLSGLAPDLDSGLAEIVARAIEKRPAERYQHMNELLADLDGVIARVGVEEHETETTVVSQRDDAASTGATAGRTPGPASDALAQGHHDAAQEVAQPALLGADDERVPQAFARIVDVRRSREVDEHIANARAHLQDLALTRASESVDLALQLQPESAEAQQFRRDIETRRTTNRGLEQAERDLAAGEFDAALRSVLAVLVTEPGHDTAQQLHDRIGAAARDHRVQAALNRARRERASGDLAAARKMLEDCGEPHDAVAAELAGIEAELQERRESFESFVEQARRRLDHGDVAAARDPMQRAMDALAGSAAAPGSDPARTPSGSSPAPVAASVTQTPARPAATLFGLAKRSGADRQPRTLAIAAGGITAAVAVAAAVWLASSGSDEPESVFAGSQETGSAELAGGVPPADPPAPESLADEAADRPDPPRAAVADPPPQDRSRGASAPRDRPPPPGPGIDRLLAEGVAAEAARDLETARDRYAGVLRRDPANPTALTGSQRVQAAMVEAAVQESLRAADAAFAAGRYDDARRRYREAFAVHAAPEAAAGLRRVDNAEALACDGATCATLVIRVTPAAEIFVDERSLGTTAYLELRLPAGRHRVLLETPEWRFPRTLTVAAGMTSELVVDLEEDGFPR